MNRAAVPILVWSQAIWIAATRVGTALRTERGTITRHSVWIGVVIALSGGLDLCRALALLVAGPGPRYVAPGIDGLPLSNAARSSRDARGSPPKAPYPAAPAGLRVSV